MVKNLSLIIKTNQDFVRFTGENKEKYAAELNFLYENLSEIYIPLLNMIERLSEEGIKSKFSIVFPPVLCSMLNNSEIQENYLQWIENHIELADKELSRNSANADICKIIEISKNKYIQLKSDFEDKYQRKIIRKFAEFQRNGLIEILGTCGTDIYIPYYNDIKEVISAQIETGLYSYKKYFGEAPDGFWLPKTGYAPGVEKIIRSYGYSYTVLDTRSFLLAEEIPSRGIFYPVRTDNSLVLFSRDSEVDEELYGEKAYSNNQTYRNENRDIGFEIDMDELKPVIGDNTVRYSTGFRYWNRNFENDAEGIYNQAEAFKQACTDANTFLKNKSEKLSKAAEYISDSDFVNLTCTFEAEKLKSNWGEMLVWFENVLRNAADYDISLTGCKDMLSNQFHLDRFVPYYSASEGAGYGENLLSSKNCWMMRYVRKASERMVDLADRFPTDTGLKNRLLNLAAKELMFAQSANLAAMIDEGTFTEYAEERFKESIIAFTAVFDSLGSNTVSTEWLTTLEMKDLVFSWMNYRIFAKKH